MLLNLKEILELAEKESYAVGSFNTPNLESVLAVVEAAQELNLPVIIQHAQCHEALAALDVIAPIMIAAAKKATVPVCVHLDHGETLGYLEKAMTLGFTSVMYDGSALSYAENLSNTKKTVVMAAKYGASVEAELGSMGKRESGGGEGMGDDTKIYTDPILAKRFVNETGIHALACSFGTTHGIYLAKPRLDFDVVKNVRESTGGIPIVMHGGSGVAKDGFTSAIKAGVRKINYFTYMDRSGGMAAGEWLKKQTDGKPVFFTDLADAAGKAMKENAKEAMRMFSLQD